MNAPNIILHIIAFNVVRVENDISVKVPLVNAAVIPVGRWR